MKNILIEVSGKVQGVWFRKYVMDQAKKLNFKGFVKNMPNGDVSIQIQGNEDNVGEFIKRIWTGSGESRVDNLRITTIQRKKLFPTFSIEI